jgi:hypothetical protein
MKAANNVMDKLVKRKAWALTTPMGTFKMGVRGSIPPNEVFCCNIRTSKAFVRSAGFGWRAGVSWTMNAEVTAENRPA